MHALTLLMSYFFDLYLLFTMAVKRSGIELNSNLLDSILSMIVLWFSFSFGILTNLLFDSKVYKILTFCPGVLPE